MAITVLDFDAAERVFNENLDLELQHIPFECTARQAAVIATTIFHAVNRKVFEYRQHSEALTMLCLAPAVPEKGFPRNEKGEVKLPEWYKKLLWPERIMDNSRILGLHSTPHRRRTILTDQPLVTQFLQRPGYIDKAQELYERAHAHRAIQLQNDWRW